MTKPTPHTATPVEEFSYDDDIVKKFLLATLGWGAIALLLGVVLASQLIDWRLNLGLPWTTFGRLRPLHTNAAIFAFVGNAMFAGIYYSTQRLLKTRMWSDRLSNFHFWGWQAIIVGAALTLPLGLTAGKEYAELEWPIAQAINVIWVIFGYNYFKTLQFRRERHIYVAIWFYIATILTVGLLHVVNTIQVPVSFWKSYPIYAGVQDALVQWWYGHNAVAFVLTTPFLGLMYYFLPKAAGRPVYSYRLSIVHFWSLVFIYIWAGPHHLLYTALPDWAQILGTAFSVMLLAPSWGGMVNGLLTLPRGHGEVRKDPVLKFFFAGLIFYGIATFEGPLLSIKAVSALGHYTDWIIGHVHGGVLGWNGFLIFALTYWLVPRLWRTELYSVRLAHLHFWLALTGTILYLVAMWTSGIVQGTMWKALDETGRLLHPDFLTSLHKIVPYYVLRALGGTLYLASYLLMTYNIWRTVSQVPIRADKAERVTASALTAPTLENLGPTPHRMLEGLPGLFTVFTTLAVLVGSVIEIVPTFLSRDLVPVSADLKPYSALELQGRDIYVREGCYTCHSQMIRQLVWETKRYGDFSVAQESIFDRPFQWGSKRTGPDLARVGGKYPDRWHVEHMMNPRATVPGSIMPSYPWLAKDKLDFEGIGRKLAVMRSLGVPYSEAEVKNAAMDARAEAKAIANRLVAQGLAAGLEDRDIVALVAYLQRLGRDKKQGILK